MTTGFADELTELDELEEMHMNLQPPNDVYEFVCQECFTIKLRGVQCAHPALKGCSELQHCIGCCDD